MAEANWYELRAEPRDRDYESLLRAALKMRCARLVLVYQRRPRRDSVAAQLHAAIQEWMVADELTHDLPMRRAGRAERLREYQWTAETCDAVIRAAAGLYEWDGGGLPEDLSLKRADGRYWLMTQGHEREGIVKLTTAERAELERLWPTAGQFL
ncbi:MAG: hypothetical protein M3Y87_02755 [Myxococcota bacterium]|nr:hypothetical protein [Myxococcota bacterium]